MGIKRIVDTSFWTDGKVDDFSPEDKYFMLYLLTNPFSTQLGIYEISIKQVAFQMGYAVDAVKVLIDRFENKYGMIIFSPATNEIAIKNFLRHSIIKGGAPVRDCLIKEIKKVKNKELIARVFAHIKDSDSLNETVKKIISEYEEKNGTLYYSNEKQNDNENDNEVSYHDTGNESLNDSSEETPDTKPKKKKTKAEEEAEALLLTVCALLGKHGYSLFTEGTPELQNAIISFAEFRKDIKKPMTDRAIDLLIRKLKSMTKDIREQTEIINQSIVNGWQGIFPLKDKQYGRKEIVPGWMNGRRELDEDEKASIQRMMSGETLAAVTAKHTISNNPELADRAEKLKQRLGSA